jgi:hypothetical protein
MAVFICFHATTVREGKVGHKVASL